jgi:hypothetical protein
MRNHQDAGRLAACKKRLMDDSEPRRRTTIVVAIAICAIAVFLRVPSCYESFWLDELHSAWTVWGSLAEVLPRARMGHQTPFYFAGLWFWKQAVGGSEVALRMSSVLAVGASCIVLTIGVTRWTRSIVAGAAAGLLMAIESNSLFFGTELRPYAFVILLASIALVCFVRLAAVDARQQDRRAWIGLISSILLAVLSQPTALGMLAWLPLVLSVVWLLRSRRQLFTFSLSDGLLALAAAAVGFAVWKMTLGETWNQRTVWASFASATRADQIWEVWDWNELLLLPLALMLVVTAAAKLRKKNSAVSGTFFPTILLATIAVMGTCLFWAVSRADWIPIWHRRYFIAVLPILACVVGGSVGAAMMMFRSAGRAGVLGSSILAAALVINLAYQQGTLVRLRTYPVALVTRGEDWRSAISWVRSKAIESDPIYVDSGLIEAPSLFSRVIGLEIVNAATPEQMEYLVFPVAGPYQIEHFVLPINLLPRPDWTQSTAFTIRRRFVIARIPASRAKNSTMPLGSKVLGFGNVSVIVLPSQLDQSF